MRFPRIVASPEVLLGALVPLSRSITSSQERSRRHFLLLNDENKKSRSTRCSTALQLAAGTCEGRRKHSIPECDA